MQQRTLISSDEGAYHKMIHTKFRAKDLQELNNYFSNPKIDKDISLIQELPDPIRPGFIFDLKVHIIYGDIDGKLQEKINSHLKTINFLFTYLYQNETFSDFVKKNTVNSHLTMTLDTLFTYLVEKKISIPKDNIENGTEPYTFTGSASASTSNTYYDADATAYAAPAYYDADDVPNLGGEGFVRQTKRRQARHGNRTAKATAN